MTMSLQEIRLKLLELAKPEKVSAPDVEWWADRARELEDYVTEGQSKRTPRNGRSVEGKKVSDNSLPESDQTDVFDVLTGRVTTD